MKFIVRWAFRFLILGVVLAVAVILLKNLILREVAETAFRRGTSLECEIDGLDLRLLSPTLVLEGVRVYHPPDLGGGRLLDLPEVHAEYAPGAVLLGNLHLRLLRVHVGELTLVEGAAGRSSLELLRRWCEEPVRPAASGWFHFTGIDTLNLSVDRVCWLRLKAGERPESTELRLENQVLTHLRTAADFEAALNRVLTPAILSRLTNRLELLRPAGRR